jgi:type IV secretion system protein VirB2
MNGQGTNRQATAEAGVLSAPSWLAYRHREQLFWMLISCLLLALCLASDAQASEGVGGTLPYESWLMNLRNSVTGPVAFSLSMIGIVVAGGALVMGGDLSGFFRTLIFIVLVFAFLVGAQNMMSNFFGRGAEIAAAGEMEVAVTTANLGCSMRGVLTANGTQPTLKGAGEGGHGAA